MLNDKLKIMFLNYGPYFGCSGVHIHFLANTLVKLGHECTVFLPHTRGAKEHFGKANYSLYSFPEMLELPLEYFNNAVLHAWTTRETVRVPTKLLRNRIKLPYLVHLEDNEILITGQFLKIYDFEEQKKHVKENPNILSKYINTNPIYFERFMLQSSGVTCIIKKLEEFVPSTVARMTFWPACEEDFFNLPQERNWALRKAFEFSEDTHIIFYPGAIHDFNVEHFSELLYAVEQLNTQGLNTKLVRSGIEYGNYPAHILELYNKHVIYVEDLNSNELPRLMAIADFLVQPGRAGDFDTYRFPSKIPFFLASARPVILPNTNVATSLKHGHDCLLTKEGNSTEIVKYLTMLMTNSSLAKSIGAQGRLSARRLFSWEKAAQALIPFYRNAIMRGIK